VLTLTVLVVAFALLESIASPAGAQHRHRNVLAVYQVRFFHSETGRSLGGGPGYAFYERYVQSLTTPDLTSFATAPQVGTSYVDGRKITVQLRRTDADYWRILDFSVREGRTLSADDVASGRFVAVVNEATAEAYFPGRSALGAMLQVDSQSFEIVGVVANEPETSRLAFADVWVPLTTTDASGFERQWLSNDMAMLYVDDASKLGGAKDELRALMSSFEYTPDPNQFDTARAEAMTALEMLAGAAVANVAGAGISNVNEDYVPEFLAGLSLIALLFMALPAMNLVNLNAGRIMERASEIGVRKAAGATRSVLVGQLIFENVVLAALGGGIALAAAPLVLDVQTGVFRYGQLGLDVPVFAAGFVFVVVFGVLSGAYPTWKMARLEPAAALRGHLHA
jgi:putative ABC transport system permease protein